MELLSLLAQHWLLTVFVALVAVLVIFVFPSIRIIGPMEIGLVTKRFSFKKLPDDNPIAFRHGATLDGVGATLMKYLADQQAKEKSP